MPMTTEQLAQMIHDAGKKAKIEGAMAMENVEEIVVGLQEEPSMAAFFHEFGQLYAAAVQR